ncbi:hypothetical protein CVT26_011435 [Gymnopilus dilepis]|uniref:Uncharacterized protein n=1 Tax=Gymnopilus dilepis TaxID=231916 RepID=A0A409X0P4_9AGAR|nr:hypothetical protein CVT26_011435 [Gymnopilus dilepis]
MTLPPRFAALKATLASSYGPNFEENATRSWGEILEELNKLAKVTQEEGSNYIPQVNFSDLHSLSKDEIAKIKRKGVLVIKDVVPDEQALKWREELKEYVRLNPGVEGRRLESEESHIGFTDESTYCV